MRFVLIFVAVILGCCPTTSPSQDQPAVQIEPVSVPVPVYTPPPKPKVPTKAQEKARFEKAKKELKAKRPKTEKAVRAILGEPNSTMVDFMGKGDLVQWYFETKGVGRDVIQCVVHRNGKISMLSY